MPISIEEFREPKFIKQEERWTLVPNEKARFIRHDEYPRNYRGDNGTFPQAGYNPNHQSTTVEKINLFTDNYRLKPR